MARTLKVAIGAIAAVLTLYVLSWPLSALFWHQISVDRVAKQTTHPSINRVRVEIWANAASYSSHRSLVFPMHRRVERYAPHVLILRLIDPDRSAKQARIHAALLELPDGSVRELQFIATRGGQPDQWLPFFVNASQFIVHLFHEEPLQLPDHVVLWIDLSVEKDGRAERQSVSVEISLIDQVRRGWGFISV